MTHEDKPAGQSKKYLVFAWSLASLTVLGAGAIATVALGKPIDASLFTAVVGPIVTLAVGSGWSIAWHDRGVRIAAVARKPAPVPAPAPPT